MREQKRNANNETTSITVVAETVHNLDKNAIAMANTMVGEENVVDLKAVGNPYVDDWEDRYLYNFYGPGKPMAERVVKSVAREYVLTYKTERELADG